MYYYRVKPSDTLILNFFYKNASWLGLSDFDVELGFSQIKSKSYLNIDFFEMVFAYFLFYIISLHKSTSGFLKYINPIECIFLNMSTEIKGRDLKKTIFFILAKFFEENS
jgi:hypothetical protein